MIIDINGDALRLLEHFIYYATDPDWQSLADAMYYDRFGFRQRIHQLAMAFENAS